MSITCIIHEGKWYMRIMWAQGWPCSASTSICSVFTASVYTHMHPLPSPSPYFHAVLLHLFFSTTPFSKVHRLPVEDCSNFTDCSACITNGGLLCGWCSVENKCSRRPQCANSNSSDGLRWVPTMDRCLTVDIASAVSISGQETAYPRETSSIVSWKKHWTVVQNVMYVTIPPIHLMNKTVCVSGFLKLSDP